MTRPPLYWKTELLWCRGHLYIQILTSFNSPSASIPDYWPPLMPRPPLYQTTDLLWWRDLRGNQPSSSPRFPASISHASLGTSGPERRNLNNKIAREPAYAPLCHHSGFCHIVLRSILSIMSPLGSIVTLSYLSQSMYILSIMSPLWSIVTRSMWQYSSSWLYF